MSEKNKADGSTDLHFKDYLRVIQNRWAVILTVLILTVATAWFVVQLQPRIYESSALVKIDHRNPDLQIFTMSHEGFSLPFYQTEFETIRSKKVLYPVIEKLNLIPVIKEELDITEAEITKDIAYTAFRENMLIVQPHRNTKLIEIACRSQDPELAAKMANLVADTYKEIRIADINERETAGLKVVERELKKAEDEYLEAKAKVERLRKELRIDEIPGFTNQESATLQDQELRQKENLLSEARNDYISRRVRMEKVKDLPVEELGNVLPAIGLEDMTIAHTKQRYLVSKAGLISLLKEGFQEGHPKVQAAKAEVEELKTQLDKLVEGIRQGLAIDLAAAQSRVENLESEVNTLREVVRLQRSDKLAPYQEAKSDAEHKKTIYEVINTRYRQQAIETQIGERPVEITNVAEPNPIPVSPKTTLIMALSVALGLVFGVSAAFFIEYLDTGVKTMDDVERFLNSKVLAVIPKGVHPLNLEGPESPNAEGYRILRAKLNLGHEEGPQVLTMVSGGPSEGKSTTAFNLAYVTAQSGISTLLIDADFRRPSQHILLGVKNNLGFADYLLGRYPINECILEGPLPHMHVMNAGKLNNSQMGAMNNARLQEVLEYAKQYYQLIVIDSPPILGISDASIIVQESDTTLLIIQHRRYPRAIAQRARQVIDDVGGNFAGVILNNVHLKSDDSYSYYTNYYSHYGYSGKEKRDIERNVRINKQKLRKGTLTQETQAAPPSGDEAPAVEVAQSDPPAPTDEDVY